MVRGSRWLKFSWWWGSEPPGMWRAIWPGRRLYWGTGVKTAPRRWQWVGPWGRGSKIRSHSGGEHWNKRWLGVSSVLLVGIAELWSVICDNRLYIWESVQHTVMISKILIIVVIAQLSPHPSNVFILPGFCWMSCSKSRVMCATVAASVVRVSGPLTDKYCTVDINVGGQYHPGTLLDSSGLLKPPFPSLSHPHFRPSHSSHLNPLDAMGIS